MYGKMVFSQLHILCTILFHAYSELVLPTAAQEEIVIFPKDNKTVLNVFENHYACEI